MPSPARRRAFDDARRMVALLIMAVSCAFAARRGVRIVTPQHHTEGLDPRQPRSMTGPAMIGSELRSTAVVRLPQDRRGEPPESHDFSYEPGNTALQRESTYREVCVHFAYSPADAGRSSVLGAELQFSITSRAVLRYFLKTTRSGPLSCWPAAAGSNAGACRFDR